MTTCTTEAHAAAVRNLATWITLEYLGVQILEADGNEPEERLEMRNCKCGSTLCRAA